MARMTISLVLGSGGARGYAHIGVIEELIAQGYDIRSIAGSSMGALVGGVHAAGKLDAFRDWARPLQRIDVLRMLDPAWTGGGLIKGDRLIDKLREMIGEQRIEDLPITYTAVAVDLLEQREVWFSRGSLFDAIRASIAIPSVLRPHQYQGRTLVDGGLLNPVPVTPTLRDPTDCTIAVDINSAAETPDGAMASTGVVDLGAQSAADALSACGESAGGAPLPARAGAGPGSTAADRNAPPRLRARVAAFFAGLAGRRERNGAEGAEPGMLEQFAGTLDIVQETITRFRLAAQPPDLLIRIPRNVGAFYEFHRAAEFIEIGRERTREALRHWRPPA